MFETYRMLGEQREAELLREAQRLRAGQAVRTTALSVSLGDSSCWYSYAGPSYR